MDWIFFHGDMPVPVAIDIFPRLWAVKGKLVWTHSDNPTCPQSGMSLGMIVGKHGLTISIMQQLRVHRHPPSQKRYRCRNTRYGPDPGARKLGQGVKMKAVYPQTHRVDDCLFRVNTWYAGGTSNQMTANEAHQ